MIEVVLPLLRRGEALGELAPGDAGPAVLLEGFAQREGLPALAALVLELEAYEPRAGALVEEHALDGEAVVPVLVHRARGRLHVFAGRPAAVGEEQREEAAARGEGPAAEAERGREGYGGGAPGGKAALCAAFGQVLQRVSQPFIEFGARPGQVHILNHA